MVTIADWIDHTIDIRENTPTVLKTRPQWVVWRYEMIKGLPTKVLYNPNEPLARAKCNEPNTWGTFEQALDTFHGNYERFNGVAFAFTADDPYAGIDLDDCIDPATGEFIWGKAIVDAFDSYTEISPSGCGVKIFLKGKKPSHTRCKVKDPGLCGDGAMEVYDHKRFFVVTGDHLEGSPKSIRDGQEELTHLCEYYWPQKQEHSANREVPSQTAGNDIEITRSDNRFNRCLLAMLSMDIKDHNDGSHRLIAAACRCVEHDLSDTEALVCLRAYEIQRCFPVSYRDDEFVKRIRDAESMTQRGKALHETVKTDQLMQHLLGPGDNDYAPRFKNVQQLIEDYPAMRTPVIQGLLREGETMNVIAAPKTGKSWLINDMATAVATGRKWLDTYETEKGNVLILDNELHGETFANRLPKVARARRIDLSELTDTLYVENMRGRLIDIFTLDQYFSFLEPGQFKVIILDAFYRFMPADTDENDNGAMARIYNKIDHYASRLECAFVLVHHTSKGNQANKSVTDVGAGAGSQSRATDSHLVLRQHEQDDAIVLDAAVRSWPPIASMCLAWEFPVWNPAPYLDPADLEKPSRRRKKSTPTDPVEPKPDWTPELFVERFLDEEPKTMDEIILKCTDEGLSQAKTKRLLGAAEGKTLVCRWKFGANQKVQFSTIPQPAKEEDSADEKSDSY
jgi:hypothetical protein